MVDLDRKDWRAIAEHASTEQNPVKRMLLVDQLRAELVREASLSPEAYREQMN